MPEEAVQTPAEPAAADPSPAIEIPKDSEAYAEWRVSQGRSPDDPKGEAKPKREAAASSDSEPSAPEAEKQPPPKRKNEGDRIHELLGDFKTHGLKPSDLKLSREELLRKLSPPEPQPKAVPEKTEQPAAAAAAPRQAEELLKEPVEPQWKDYNGDWDAFDVAIKKYNREYAKFVAQQAVLDDRRQRAIEANQERWRQKLTEAKARYGGEADQAIVKTAVQISRDEKIHPAVKAILDDSDVLADLMYVMGSDEDEFSLFLTEARERPGKAIRRAVLLEHLVEQELAKGTKQSEPLRGENGQFQAAAKPPAKKTTAAPAPPAEVSARSSPPENEIMRAVSNGDMRTAIAAERRRLLAQAKGL